MDTLWSASLLRQYDETIDMVAGALRDCPAELWEESMWEVRRDHPFVLPVRRNGGNLCAGQSDDQAIQVFSEFWNVAYHALYFLDLYLQVEADGFNPPAPFANEQDAGVLPHRVYTRQELLAYLEHNRQKATVTLAGMTDEQARLPCGPEGHQEPFAQKLLGNVRHVQEHGAQLNMFLGQRAGWIFDVAAHAS
ncbi:MAG TPA: DinB family protein [Actinopolymorphaceae bacterium]|nr:DinB family protein [Actinopolymorphaceae bacterium]